LDFEKTSAEMRLFFFLLVRLKKIACACSLLKMEGGGGKAEKNSSIDQRTLRF